jgi:hypothetical protein
MEMKNSLDFVRVFYNECLKACKKDSYNLILNKHLGDIVYPVAPRRALLERFNDAPIHYLVRPKHVFLLKMYGVTNYTIIDMDIFIKANTDALKILFDDGYFSDVDRDVQESAAFICFFSCLPQKGIPFICDSIFFNWTHHKKYWGTRWWKNLEMAESIRCELPDSHPVLSESVKEKIASIAPVDNIVLVAPEAFTAEELPPRFWQIVVNEIQNSGYKVIMNSGKLEYMFKGTISSFYLSLSLEDVVALGYACAYVFSLRSGLCDVLIGKQDRMYVFYPETMQREYWGLNSLFAVDKNVLEICIRNFNIDDISWEGKNLAVPIRSYLHKEKKKSGWRKLVRIIKKGLRYWKTNA